MNLEAWAERLYSKTTEDPDTGCWVWSAGKPPANGYPIWFGPEVLTPEGKSRYAGAHRWSYVLANGEIPDGMEIDHLCFARGCINPDHLEAVTHDENIRRMRQRQAVIRADLRAEFMWVPANARAYLAARQIRHGELGDALGWSPSKVHQKLSGKADWSEDDVARVAAFLDVERDRLLEPCVLMTRQAVAA